MNDIERIAIESACTRLFKRFSWCLDDFDYDLAETLFTADAVFVRIDEVFEGRDGVRASLEGRAPDRRTVHLINNLLIDVVDADSARGRGLWTIFAYKGDVPPGTHRPLSSPDAIGEYRLEFARTAEGWQIAACRLSVRFMKAAPTNPA